MLAFHSLALWRYFNWPIKSSCKWFWKGFFNVDNVTRYKLYFPNFPDIFQFILIVNVECSLSKFQVFGFLGNFPANSAFYSLPEVWLNEKHVELLTESLV